MNYALCTNLHSGTTADFLRIVPTATTEINIKPDQVSQLYNNPAGVSLVNKTQLLTSYLAWFEGINVYSSALAVPVRKNVFGFLLTYLSYPDQEEYIEQEDGSPFRTGNLVSAGNFSFGLSWARAISGGFSTGAVLKVLSQRYDTKNEKALCLDLGLFYNRADRFSFGLALRNLGPGINGFNLPGTVNLGTAYSFSRVPVTLSLSQQSPLFSGVSETGLGLAFTLNRYVTLNSGLGRISSLKNFPGILAGLEIILPRTKSIIAEEIPAAKLGYSFSAGPEDFFFPVHRFSLFIEY